MSDCKTLTGHQKIAYNIIKRTYNNIVGGLENSLMDNEKESEEYQSYFELLHSEEKLASIIAKEVINTLYGRENRFAGKKWILQTIIDKLKEDGYYPN